MQAYGRKKGHTHVEGHQECGICHPVQKNKKRKARRESAVVCRERLLELEEEYPEIYGK